jgi:hypothetical protein
MMAQISETEGDKMLEEITERIKEQIRKVSLMPQ